MEGGGEVGGGRFEGWIRGTGNENTNFSTTTEQKTIIFGVLESAQAVLSSDI